MSSPRGPEPPLPGPSPRAATGADATRPLPPARPADPTARIGAGPLDRAGEVAVGWSRRCEDAARHAWRRARAQSQDRWAVAATIAVLALFLLLVALLA